MTNPILTITNKVWREIMKEETKGFSLRNILTVTTGRLLTKRKSEEDNGISDLYQLLGWMTQDSPFTHQLSRFAEECKPWLLRWFPELSKIPPESSLDILIEKHGGECAIELWLKHIEETTSCQSYYDVPRIPMDDHDNINAYDELVQMRGTDENIIIHEVRHELD